MSEDVANNIKKEFLRLNKDLRAEFIAMELMDKGFRADQIYFAPQGLFRRSYRKDIMDIRFEDEDGEDLKVFFHVSREGIYDALPEGLFHKPIQKKIQPSKDEIIDEFKLHRKEKASARKFFLPLDNEFIRERLLMEMEERRGAVEYLFSHESESVILFSEIFKHLSESQSLLVARLLPVLNGIRGDLDTAIYFISEVLEEQVVISSHERKQKRFLADENMTIDNCKLGHTFILGDSFEEAVSVLRFDIGPITKTQFRDYFPKGKKDRIFRFLCNLLIPIEYVIETSLLLKDEEKYFELEEPKRSKEEEKSPAFLGYNVYL